MAQFKNGLDRVFTLSFEKNIFINCPFDKEYLPMLKTLLYVIKKLVITLELHLNAVIQVKSD